MKSKLISYVAIVAAISLIAVGCSQSTPTPAGTNNPAQTSETNSNGTAAKVEKADPTATSTDQKSDTSASKSNYPQKGKVLTVVVPYPPGGGNDLASRTLAIPLEKELGTTVQVVNKAGASGQVGTTEVVQSKPDGYTLGYPTLSAVIISYLDPERQAAFDRKSFVPVASDCMVQLQIAVKADSPYKSVEDLVEAAKAKPKTVKVGIYRLSQEQLALMQLEEMTGAKFAHVGFDGGAPALTALLGGHIDAAVGIVVNFLPHTKSGDIRVLGTMDIERSEFMPDVPTFKEQGYDLVSLSTRVYLAPADTPQEYVDILAGSIKNAMEDESYKNKMKELAFTRRYVGPQELTTLWDETESIYKPLIELAKKK
ncbi:MAG: tripartite tricarboxylate transporter substrate binding protein [Chloroflexota bacterium]|jgi:tripartite-type tricarboxylate transporter receptor subunit TctC